jgi:hypothetical protein
MKGKFNGGFFKHTTYSSFLWMGLGFSFNCCSFSFNYTCIQSREVECHETESWGVLETLPIEAFYGWV